MSVRDIDEMVTEGGDEALQKLLSSIAQYDQTTLVSRPQQWGTINFEAAEADVTFVLSLAEDLDTLPTTLLPPDVVEAVVERLREVAEILGKVHAFSIESGTVVERRDELVRELRPRDRGVTSGNRTVALFLRLQEPRCVRRLCAAEGRDSGSRARGAGVSAHTC